MTTPKDGGAAFPIPGGEGYPGMSLRDYFAAKAMQAYSGEDDLPTNETVAGWAYQMADAMLAERSK